ncbi:MAG: DUF1080 domain-containing protein [Flavobacteriaceae bacterium]
MKNSIKIFLFSVFLLSGCLGKVKENEAVIPTKELQTQNLEKTEDWLYLFDGTTTNGWRGYNSKALPASWIIEDGALKSLGKGGDIGGDIVYSAQEFENFELYLEWKISDGGNSGVFYHVQEGEQYESPYQNAPEYQVIDQIGFPQKLEDWQSIGADYAMYITDKSNLEVKPAGEWNTTRIIFQPNKVEHWLNGKKVVEFVPWSDDWNMKKKTGKWKDYPDYGAAKKGFIGLQDHGSFIWFKNIKIKEL